MTRIHVPRCPLPPRASATSPRSQASLVAVLRGCPAPRPHRLTAARPQHLCKLNDAPEPARALEGAPAAGWSKPEVSDLLTAFVLAVIGGEVRCPRPPPLGLARLWPAVDCDVLQVAWISIASVSQMLAFVL